MRTLQEQLIRDLQASWQKTTLLVLLLLVGLCFWVPPLLRAVGGSSPAGGATSAASSVAVTAPPAASLPSTENAPSLAPDSKPEAATFSWRHAEDVMKKDPLVRSAEVAAIQGDPFRVDHDQFPPPALFADTPPEEPRSRQNPAVNVTVTNPMKPPGSDGLVLKSTIIGVKRRAAFINTTLYFEGAEVTFQGQPYVLTAVHRHKVVLQRGDEVVELLLAADPAAANIAVERTGM
jgi:hypothetical protein